MIRGLILILAEHLPSARALATTAPFSLTEEEAANLFVPAGSPSGDGPATHYWAAGLFTPTHWSAIQGLAMLLPWADCQAYDIATQPDFPDTQLAVLGLQRWKGEMS
jgi:hypothetical protein